MFFTKQQEEKTMPPKPVTPEKPMRPHIVGDVQHGLVAVERALSADYAPIAEPERIARIGEQQGAVMKKVCDEVTRQFETKIELAEAAISDLVGHRDHLLRELSKYLNDEIDLRVAEVERTKQAAKDITAWVQSEAQHFAEHATEVADKLCKLQERISSAANGLPPPKTIEGELRLAPPKTEAEDADKQTNG